ncbi:hypothetical protein PR048_012608 [Dryococelus australis]|uniref:HTH psq-type domain-containing protein n=1 Tax=Dryococelus australis TaxID=614101 RepID=A0ABQ9HPU2_9NEOP|nr:hypothetical protein PR048_012608 [Dryococelus australis]
MYRRCSHFGLSAVQPEVKSTSCSLLSGLVPILMVHTYKRKTQQSWSEKSTLLAIAAVKSGEKSYKAACREYNVPHGTLQRRAQRNSA